MSLDLAVWLDSYRAGLRGGLEIAAQQGFRLVEANAAADELEPREFSASARRHLRKFLGDLGLQVDGFAVDYPGAGLADPARASERLDRFKGTLELAAGLNVPRTVVSLAGLGDPKAGSLPRELLETIADLADRIGVDTAIRDPGGLSTAALDQIRQLGCPRLRVSMDTATDAAEPAVVARAAELLGGVYLRDVRRSGRSFEEVSFGKGEVDFEALLAQVAGADPRLGLILRHDSAGGVDALRQGREYIRSLLGRVGIR